MFVQGPIQPVMVDPMEGCGLQRSSAQSSLSGDDNLGENKKEKEEKHRLFSGLSSQLPITNLWGL